MATDSRVPRRHIAKLLHWLAMICRKEIPIHLVKGNKAFRESPLAELLVAEALGRVQCMQLSRVASNIIWTKTKNYSSKTLYGKRKHV